MESMDKLLQLQGIRWSHVKAVHREVCEHRKGMFSWEVKDIAESGLGLNNETEDHVSFLKGNMQGKE